jgi:transposase
MGARGKHPDRWRLSTEVTPPTRRQFRVIAKIVELAEIHQDASGLLNVRSIQIPGRNARTGETWARKFFDNWCAALEWQGLVPFEKFAKTIDKHWEGIAAYCRPENKVPLGFVEGLNSKIRVLQRRAYGLRDEEYLRLKILTCMLPEI